MSFKNSKGEIMKKGIILSGLVAVLIFSACVSSALPINENVFVPVDFNGDFEEGVTLYSDWIDVSGGKLMNGRDVYPIRPTGMERERVCETTNRTQRVRDCEIIEYDSVRTCYDLGGDEQYCKVSDLPRSRKSSICTTEIIEVPVERCRYVWNSTYHGALCANPTSGHTNQLNLENFKYSYDNVTFHDVPYIHSKVNLSGGDVLFRLTIPDPCYPEYSYNDAVFIQQ